MTLHIFAGRPIKLGDKEAILLKLSAPGHVA